MTVSEMLGALMQEDDGTPVFLAVGEHLEPIAVSSMAALVENGRVKMITIRVPTTGAGSSARLDDRG